MMLDIVRAALLALLLSACASVGASARLEPLAFLEGCWIGSFAANPELKDERCFVFEESRNRMRDTHTVVGTGYSGETIYAWDEAASRIGVVYRSSAGGVMTGSVQAGEGGIVIPDVRHVGADGAVQELRSHWRRESAERFTVITDRRENGAWREFMRIVYERKPPAGCDATPAPAAC